VTAQQQADLMCSHEKIKGAYEITVYHEDSKMLLRNDYLP
jgi:hypothetical protein